MARPQLRLALIAAVLLISALTVPRVFAPREIAVPNNLVGAYVDVSRPSPLNPSPGARVQAAFDQMPLAFIANQGQLDDRVAYYVQGRDTSLYFTPQGVTFGLTGPA